MNNTVEAVVAAPPPKSNSNFAVEQRSQPQQPRQHIHQIQNTNGAFINHLNHKSGTELIWNGESTLLLVNFPDDKKFLVPNNAMRNIFVPFTATQNMDAILKKVNLGAQLQQQPQTVQLTSVPKLSSHLQHPTHTDAPIKVEKFHDIPAAQVTPTHVGNLPGMVDILVDGQQLSMQTPYTLSTKSNGIAGPPSTTPKPVGGDFGVIPSDMMLSSNMDSDISPMRCHSTCDDMYLNEADIFLNDTGRNGAASHKMLQQSHRNGMIKKESTEHDNNGIVDMKSFDDLELMELMGQQLDMDISDDSCQPVGNMTSDKMLNMTSGNGSNSLHSPPHSMSCRRDMNPSLQPSLSELIQQQQSPSAHGSNNSRLNGASNGSDNSNMHATFMNQDNMNDYNSNFYLDSNNISSNHNNNLHLGSMDIEYFDNTLAQFDFAIPCGNQTNGLMNNASQIGPYSDAQMNHTNTNSMMSSHSIANDCPTTSNDVDQYYTNGGTTAHSNILDLFNIDDFKMSADPMNWYAV